MNFLLYHRKRKHSIYIHQEVPRALPWKKMYFVLKVSFSSVQFSRSVVSDSLWPHESQHARPPCPSPTPGVHSNSCPLSWWCHPVISFSVVPVSSHPQSLLASDSFPVSHLDSWGGQSIGVSAIASDLPVNTQDWSQKCIKTSHIFILNYHIDFFSHWYYKVTFLVSASFNCSWILKRCVSVILI